MKKFFLFAFIHLADGRCCLQSAVAYPDKFYHIKSAQGYSCDTLPAGISQPAFTCS